MERGEGGGAEDKVRDRRRKEREGRGEGGKVREGEKGQAMSKQG